MSEEKKDFVVKDRRRFSQDNREEEAKDGHPETTDAREDKSKAAASAEDKRDSET